MQLKYHFNISIDFINCLILGFSDYQFGKGLEKQKTGVE